MIKDKQRIAAGALPSETYAKLIDRTKDVGTSHGFAWINITALSEVRIDMMESRLQHGAKLFDQNIADIRRLLLDA